jgi:hypothetical protein
VKIHGQNLSDVLRRIPWQYKIVCAAGAAFILMAIVQVPRMLAGMTLLPPEPPFKPVQISGGGAAPQGALDAAIARNPAESRAWMAYTAQKPSAHPAGEMEVRLASAKIHKEGCPVWKALPGALFISKPDTLLAPDGQTPLRAGAWQAETPALVYDPDDPGRAWKAYAYKYFRAGTRDMTEVARRYGVISYRYAAKPEGPWSVEQWLFSAAAGYPPPPYEQLVQLHLSRLSPQLMDVVAFARPSVVYRKRMLAMTLSAFTAAGGTAALDRVVMIVSLDHGNSWRYAGAVLRRSALPKPYTQIMGASLVQHGGEVYLAAALGDDRQRGQGTFIFGFDDFASGTLSHDAAGLPAVLRHLPLPEPAGAIGGGAAAYAEPCGGLMQSAQVRSTPSFQLYQTKVKPIEATPAKGEK